jgi:hypothetical protein
VYALPKSDSAYEDMQWVLHEIVKGGGDASICDANFLDGLTDEEIEALFRSARKVDYDAVAAEVRQLERALPRRGHAVKEAVRLQIETNLVRLSKRLGDVSAIDFFGTPERGVVADLIAGIEARLKPADKAAPSATMPPPSVQKRTWVTRVGIHVDRMASAWLIQRFIDKEARFKFVPAKGYRPKPGELRFDMFEAEFTHEGDNCTFEVLLARFSLDDPGLRPIAEIIHDIDLKDGKFGRQDTIGFERLVNGIAIGHKDDQARLARASAVLDDLYAYYRRQRPDQGGAD